MGWMDVRIEWLIHFFLTKNATHYIQQNESSLPCRTYADIIQTHTDLPDHPDSVQGFAEHIFCISIVLHSTPLRFSTTILASNTHLLTLSDRKSILSWMFAGNFVILYMVNHTNWMAIKLLFIGCVLLDQILAGSFDSLWLGLFSYRYIQYIDIYI